MTKRAGTSWADDVMHGLSHKHDVTRTCKWPRDQVTSGEACEVSHHSFYLLRPFTNLRTEVAHHDVFINPRAFGYGVKQQRHQFPNFPEISLKSLNIHILYTILKATQISHEQLKISQKTPRQPESSPIQTLTTRFYNGF
jgi:hypothetical protein